MALAKHNGAAKIFTRADLESGKAVRTIDVTVGDMTFRLRHLTASEMMAYIDEEASDTEITKRCRENGEDIPNEVVERGIERAARHVCMLAVDEKGERTLSDSEDDLQLLLTKVSGSILNEAIRKVIRATNAEGNTAGEK